MELKNKLEKGKMWWRRTKEEVAWSVEKTKVEIVGTPFELTQFERAGSKIKHKNFLVEDNVTFHAQSLD